MSARRSQRMRDARRAAKTISAHADGIPACPDCPATAAPWEQSPGVVVIKVVHDLDCPWFKAHEARNHRLGEAR
ncbi:hypothetical protein Back2_10860 [Nocardioides baekrokdamisoli]|uniref:Uncharacterized protein n=1 Tax=Nocardioides baekrokdamisoli TaxID=1804624 RepID=A0A3G9J1F4_9ACTN|nr:hypothetical protein Back2_10860 [Nocardioides baekrokdamisoli]